MEPGDAGDRHAGLHGLLDQQDLFLGSVASAALNAVMISTRSMGFDIGACLDFHLGPHGCAACPVELGAAPANPQGPESLGRSGRGFRPFVPQLHHQD